jgi:hypothetical protein
VLALVGLALLIAGDLLPYLHENGYSPRVFSFAGSSLPAIVTRFLTPSATLAFTAIGGWMATREDLLVRGVAAGLLLATGVIELFQFIYFTTITDVFPVPAEIQRSPWTDLGLAGGVLVIVAGVATLRTTRASIAD